MFFQKFLDTKKKDQISLENDIFPIGIKTAKYNLKVTIIIKINL